MKNISIMIKPASSLCNMKCRYCFYTDVVHQREICSYGMMSQDTTKLILKNIRGFLRRGDRINFAFQGGEPTLAGLDFYRFFVDQIRCWGDGIQVSYAFQTNGLLLDWEWCEFLARNRFLIGISFDLLPFCHDEARTDGKGQGTYQRVMDRIQMMEQYHIEYNVLCTLTRRVAAYPQKVWKVITRNDFKWVQFTPCLGGLVDGGDDSYTIDPKSFASFYIQLFACWLSDFRKGAYRSIKLIDDLIGYLACGMPAMCGIDGKCQPQIVVEADGSTFPCDFYCLDEYYLGNLREQSLEELFRLSVHSAMSGREKKLPCSGCIYEEICSGGCRRMRKEVYCGSGIDGCGMRIFLDYSMKELQNIAEKERNFRSRSIAGIPEWFGRLY